MKNPYKFMFGVFVMWTLLSAVSIAMYVLFVEWIWQAWYYILWPMCAGGVFFCYGERIKAIIFQHKFHAAVQYVLLVYLMVLIEEVLASTLNHLSEGYSLPLYIQRIGQFWAFNILAFSGPAWGSYLIFSRIQFTRAEMFTFFGLFGLIFEGLLYKIFFVPGESLAAFVLVPLNFWVYGLIFLPAILSIEDMQRRNMRFVQRFALLFALIVLLTLPFSVVLDYSREAYPDLYPPKHMIP